MPLTGCSKENLHPMGRRLRAELPHGGCRPIQLLLHRSVLASERRCCVRVHRGEEIRGEERRLCNPITENREWQNWISDGTLFTLSKFRCLVNHTNLFNLRYFEQLLNTFKDKKLLSGVA